MVGRYRGGPWILALTGVEERQEGRLWAAGSPGLVVIWGVGTLGPEEQLLQGSFLQKHTGVSLVKRSRQVWAIQGPCYMLHFSCETLNREGSLWRGSSSDSWLLACLFCRHLLERRGQQLSGSPSPLAPPPQALLNSLHAALGFRRSEAQQPCPGPTPPPCPCSSHITTVGK